MVIEEDQTSFLYFFKFLLYTFINIISYLINMPLRRHKPDYLYAIINNL